MKKLKKFNEWFHAGTVMYEVYIYSIHAFLREDVNWMQQKSPACSGCGLNSFPSQILNKLTAPAGKWQGVMNEENWNNVYLYVVTKIGFVNIIFKSVGLSLLRCKSFTKVIGQHSAFEISFMLWDLIHASHYQWDVLSANIE